MHASLMSKMFFCVKFYIASIISTTCPSIVYDELSAMIASGVTSHASWYVRSSCSHSMLITSSGTPRASICAVSAFSSSDVISSRSVLPECCPDNDAFNHRCEELRERRDYYVGDQLVFVILDAYVLLRVREAARHDSEYFHNLSMHHAAQHREQMVAPVLVDDETIDDVVEAFA